MIFINPQSELIVTNPDSWCINDNPRTWNRSTPPNLVKGVAAFRALKPTDDRRLVKIGLIYPDCRNISKYLNECDVRLIKDGLEVDGVSLLRFGEISAFFHKDE